MRSRLMNSQIPAGKFKLLDTDSGEVKVASKYLDLDPDYCDPDEIKQSVLY